MIRFVLLETSHPGNLGAAARAMKTMGLSELVLVKPAQFPSAEATARAAGADDILSRAKVCKTLSEAVEGCRLVLACSGRRRSLEQPVVLPEEAAQRAVAEANDYSVAIVFGRERYGMDNEELGLADAVITIDTDPDFSSLNLGAAVQLLAYEVRRAVRAQQGDQSQLAGASTDGGELNEPPATAERMHGLFEHMQQALLDIRFLHPDKPYTLMQRIQRMMLRARPSDTEVNILRGMLSAAQKAAGYAPARRDANAAKASQDSTQTGD